MKINQLNVRNNGKGRCRAICIILLLSLFSVFGVSFGWSDIPRTSEATAPLRVTAVQTQIDEAMYKSEAAFAERVSGIVEAVMEEYRPDLIVFPEYLNVFFSLIPYADKVAQVENFDDGLKAIHRSYPEIDSLRTIFLEQADYTRERLDAVWGGIADRWNVTIAAGTYFARHDAAPSRETTTSGKEELRNRLLVYGPDGNCIYTQDKVYLTDFESDEVELRPAEVDDAGFFFVTGKKIGITLCRDTFFDDWNEKMEDVFLWIDLKANGAVFSMEEQVRFVRALPERISETKVPFGLTVCLTGRFLDLFWEGETSFIRPTENGYQTLVTSETPTLQDIVFCDLVPIE